MLEGEKPGALFEGTVLLRCSPPPFELELGVLGPVTLPLEFLEETDMFRRRASYFLRLSAPPLALEAERLMVVFCKGGGGYMPPWMFWTVWASAAVPVMPNRKLSWFSIKKTSTSWLSL